MPCVFFFTIFSWPWRARSSREKWAGKSDIITSDRSRAIYSQLRMKTSQLWEIILLHGFARCVISKIDRKYLLTPMLIFPRLILLWRHPETILVFSGIHQSTRTVMSDNYDIPVQLTLFPLYVSRCWCIYFHGQSVRYGPFPFFLLRAIKRLDARVVPSHRRYINFKLFALIFAAVPPTIEMRPQKCNFFNLASNYEKRDSRMSKVSSEQPCMRWNCELHILRSRNGPANLLPLYKRKTDDI